MNLNEEKTSNSVEIAKVINSTLPSYDLQSRELPDLREEMQELPMDLNSEYWSPEAVGESRFVFFQQIAMMPVQDGELGDRELETAILLEQMESGEYRRIRNTSRRLVGVMREAQIQPGTPFKITCRGKKRNKKNSYQSDDWDIRSLVGREQVSGLTELDS